MPSAALGLEALDDRVDQFVVDAASAYVEKLVLHSDPDWSIMGQAMAGTRNRLLAGRTPAT